MTTVIDYLQSAIKTLDNTGSDPEQLESAIESAKEEINRAISMIETAKESL